MIKNYVYWSTPMFWDIHSKRWMFQTGLSVISRTFRYSNASRKIVLIFLFSIFSVLIKSIWIQSDFLTKKLVINLKSSGCQIHGINACHISSLLSSASLIRSWSLVSDLCVCECARKWQVHMDQSRSVSQHPWPWPRQLQTASSVTPVTTWRVECHNKSTCLMEQ